MRKPGYRLKYLAAALLAIYCLAFFRADSTQESMVRAILLEQNEESWTVGLLYQAPEAAADSSKASAEIRFVAAQETTLEKALAAAQEVLPQAANYRVCDYLLLMSGTGWQAIEDYEALVLAQQCGRTAARVQVCRFTCASLSEESEASEQLLSSLLDTAKTAGETAPRLYEKNGQGGMVLPQIQLENGEAVWGEEGVYLTPGGAEIWDNEKTELYRLLTGQGGVRRFWPDDHPLELKRCTLSVSWLREGVFLLRMDCHTAAGQTPDVNYTQWLSDACSQAVAEFWEKGMDVLGLGAHQALRAGESAFLSPEKNACPQLQTDVYFTTVL